MTITPQPFPAATLAEWIEILTHPQGITEDCRRFANSLLNSTASDRVTIARASLSAVSIIAMVPPDRFDPRSEIVLAAQRLLAQFRGSAHETLYLSDERAQTDDGMQESFEHYRRVSGLSHALLIKESAQASTFVCSMILLENAAANPRADLDGQMELLRQILPVLQSIVSHHASWKSSLRQRIAFARPGQRWKWSLILLAVALFALVAIPLPFSVPVEGSLEPIEKRVLFAPEQGVLDQLLAEHGSKVKQDQPLIVLRQPERELEAQRIQGEIETNETQLLSLRATKTQGDGNRQLTEMAQLTAQEEDLKIRIVGLKRQLALIRSELERMTLRSPIDGVLVAWDAKRKLRDRPVQQGEYLFEVHQIEAGWEAQIEIPDRFAGYVIAAQSQAPTTLHFRMRSDATRVHAAQVDQIDRATQLDRYAQPYVPGKAKFEPESMLAPRAGARIVGKVDCGYRPLGFVLFHELIDLLRRNFWI